MRYITPAAFKTLCASRPIDKIVFEDDEMTCRNPCIQIKFGEIVVRPKCVDGHAACILKNSSGKIVFRNLYKVGISEDAPAWTLARLFCNDTESYSLLIDWKQEEGGTA